LGRRIIAVVNGVERVKLTDFGLARAGDDASISHIIPTAGLKQPPLGCRTDQALGRRIIALVSSTAARPGPDRLAPEGAACLF
jgi:hypothetical protein